jgi:hypothetical protein
MNKEIMDEALKSPIRFPTTTNQNQNVRLLVPFLTGNSVSRIKDMCFVVDFNNSPVNQLQEQLISLFQTMGNSLKTKLASALVADPSSKKGAIAKEAVTVTTDQIQLAPALSINCTDLISKIIGIVRDSKKPFGLAIRFDDSLYDVQADKFSFDSIAGQQISGDEFKQVIKEFLNSNAELSVLEMPPSCAVRASDVQ